MSKNVGYCRENVGIFQKSVGICGEKCRKLSKKVNKSQNLFTQKLGKATQ